MNGTATNLLAAYTHSAAAICLGIGGMLDHRHCRRVDLEAVRRRQPSHRDRPERGGWRLEEGGGNH